MATSPRSTSTSRVLSPSSLASSFNFVASSPTMHAADNSSSDESFASFSGDSSEDDEIVWSVSDLSASIISSQRGLLSPEIFSDDDFIVLGQPQPSTRAVSARASGAPSVSSIDGLSDVFTNLAVDSEDSDEESVRPSSQASSRPRRRSRRIAAAKRAAASAADGPKPSAQTPPATPKRKKSKTTVASPALTLESKKAKKKARKARKAAASQVGAAPAQERRESGLGARPIVDDVSEVGDVKPASLYEDAVQYVSSFLSSPSDETKTKSNLTLLQALIVELGLCSATTSSGSEESFYHLPSLPRTITAAKAMLKSNVFLNVRDYLEQRNNGLDALRRVMHPSRKALVKDLSRGKGQRKVSRGFVKSTGLGVLLVTCYA